MLGVPNKLQYVSNLHRHDLRKVAIRPERPYLAVCGNVGDMKTKEYTGFFDAVCRDFEKVFFVPGVHDYLSAPSMYQADVYFRGLEVHNRNLTVMTNRVVDLGDEGRVVGSVLWPRLTAMAAMYEGYMLDIKDEHGDYMTPKKINRLHEANVYFLVKELMSSRVMGDGAEKGTVVLTHFSPSYAFNADASSPAYVPRQAISNRAVNMEHLLGPGVDMWVVGAPGVDMEANVNGVRVCSRPYVPT